LISDRTVDRLHGVRTARTLSEAGYDVPRVRLHPGEGSKRLESVERVWRAALAAGVDRSGTFAALGGGVVGDIVGFAAATFMRGTSWVNLPTTLLAMVDACVGGKTGINLPQGKNLVGAFHPPRLVLIDTAFLRTLPDTEWRCGMAEVVKHGVVGDRELLDRCQRGRPTSPEEVHWLVARAVGVKIRLIEADPWDRGVREALNFGHTIGHALETASRFRLRHGEAVSIGMVSEALFAERIGLAGAGLAEALRSILQGLGLPTSIPNGIRLSEVVAAVGFDKKRRENQVRFSLPRSVGEMEVGVVVRDWPNLLAEA
jgi:3-dehydroquinate synthase